MVKGQISVIMSVYNCGELVRTSIDSILAQTYTNWKMIICNDCSTDNTVDIIKEYADKYPGKFVIIHNEKNSRLAASLNHCLKYADGEFCARMDGDDYVAPDRFEKQIVYLREHPEIHLVGTLMQTFDDQGNLGRIIHYDKMPDKYSLRFGPCFAHASIMTYTDVYNKIGGYTVSARTMRSQDYDLWFRFFAKEFRGANIQEPLYFFREDTNAFLRRKPRLYLWAVVTRYKGFRALHYPLHYYCHILSPLFALVRNEFRKLRAKSRTKTQEKVS